MATAYINERSTSYFAVKSLLLKDKFRHAPGKFDRLNSHLRRGLITAGQLVIVPDDSSPDCTFEEAWLMQHAARVDQALWQDPSAAHDVLNNYDLVQSLLGYSSIGLGSTTSAWGGHLGEVRKTLVAIEQLHQTELKNGTSGRFAFIAKRQALFRTLDGQLQGAARYGTGLRGNQSLKRVLGISTKSYLNKNEIAGYAQRISRIASTAKMMGNGTYIGMALDVGVTALEIQEACAFGREGQCRKAKYVEGAKLVGSVSGAYGGGLWGARGGRILCAIGVGTVTGGWGALGCAIIGGAAGGYVGGKLGGASGTLTGELLYEGAE